jgi:hypothetical protein
LHPRDEYSHLAGAQIGRVYRLSGPAQDWVTAFDDGQYAWTAHDLLTTASWRIPASDARSIF